MYAQQDKWIRTFSSPRPGGLSLVCFPFSGASADVYRDWSGELPGVGVSGVQYPGRGPRSCDPLITDFNAMVTRVESALARKVKPPFALYGHSLGAAIAFEVCRRLESRGTVASHLLVSGCAAPHRRRPECTHELPDADFVEHLRKMNGTPREVLANAELMNLLLPVIRADYALSKGGASLVGTRVSCPLTAFAGEDDPEVPADTMEAWDEYTRARFRFCVFPGDHFFLQQSRGMLLEEIARELSRDGSLGARR